ncbi:MAG: glycerol-3-phosphate 1-O-acyltransferase PlsY [Dehalococcoidales bacterium]|nr:glycerol-3-phosphate 1-O-acyltransferase PlsY [Dehalococcoidales bacterium]
MTAEIIIKIIAAFKAAYLLGSIPSAYIMGRLTKKIDIRTVGSHNMGAMNSFYNLGKGVGVMVLAADVLKGVAAVALADLLFNIPNLYMFICGFIVVLGHNYPVWLKFKGGKGGATAIGAIIYFIPWGIPIGLAVFLLLVLITKFPTLSYGIAMISFPFVSWLVYDRPDYILYTALLILVPFLSYIPRIKEMKSKGGSWSRVVKRKNLKDRF